MLLMQKWIREMGEGCTVLSTEVIFVGEGLSTSEMILPWAKTADKWGTSSRLTIDVEWVQ